MPRSLRTNRRLRVGLPFQETELIILVLALLGSSGGCTKADENDDAAAHRGRLVAALAVAGKDR